MNLVVDSGNTRIKYGLFNHKKLMETGFLKIFEIPSFVETKQIEKIIFSSVTYLDNFQVPPGVEYLQLNPDTPLPIKNVYKSPQTLGTDRIAAAVGTQFFFKNENVLNIDTGTCIKYNMVNANGEFVGGSISPGIFMRYKALNAFTDKLPLLEPDFCFNQLIGGTTAESIHSGVLFGVLAEVNGIINQYREKFSNLKIIVSGGDTTFLAKHIKNRIFAEPNLVLIGLNEILLHYFS